VTATAGRATSTVGPGSPDPAGPDDEALHQNRVNLSVEVRRLTRAEHERVEHLLDLPDGLTRPAELAALLRGWQRIWREIKRGCSGPGPIVVVGRRMARAQRSGATA